MIWPGRFACLLLLTFVVAPLQAADISRDVREGREDETISRGGYLELDVGLEYGTLPVAGAAPGGPIISIGGHYRIRRFFIDALAEGYNQFQFGFNAWSGQTWSIDLLAAASERGIDSEFSDELESLNDRPAGLNGGIRATGYAGPYILQFEALNDISDTHDGYVFTSVIGRKWLLRNWNLHVLAGARYQSREVVDYLFGIDDDEAGNRFAAYSANSGITYVSEVGVTYPLSEHWIFHGTGRWWELPDSISDSPFITDQDYLSLTALFTFVY